jgi:hypothetical protein
MRCAHVSRASALHQTQSRPNSNACGRDIGRRKPQGSCNVEAQIGEMPTEGRARAAGGPRINVPITAQVEFEGARNGRVLAAVIGVHDDMCGKRLDRWIAVGVHGDIGRSAHAKNKADTRA